MCKLKCNCGGNVDVHVNANRFTAQCKECHYGMSGELSHTSSGLPVGVDSILVAVARVWVEFGSGSIEGDWHAAKNEVKLNNCNIGYNVMQSLIRTRDDFPGWVDNNATQSLLRTRDDFPGWFDNKEDLKNV